MGNKVLSLLSNPMKWFIENRILHGSYSLKEEVPAEIHRLAAAYEGVIPNCQGWNMPISFIASHADPTSPLRAYLDHAEYMIVYPKTDLQTKKHELLHAQYAMNPSYREQVRAQWKALTSSQQQRIYQVLRGLGYPDDSERLLDEFQAYQGTERSRFFGLRMAHKKRK